MNDALDMAAFGGGGFLFRHIAELTKAARANRKEGFELEEKSKEAASGRRGGTWMRRAIYGLVAFAFVSVILAGFLNRSVILEYELHRSLLGLIEWDKIKHVSVDGVVFLKENRTAFLRLVSFYLGQGVR